MFNSCMNPIIGHCCKLAKPVVKGSACLNATQIRNTWVLKRQRPVRLYREDKKPPIRPANYIYDLVENTVNKPDPDVTCILTKPVLDVGMAGRVLNVKANFFRKKLLAAGVAVYASPENLEEYADLIKKYNEDIASGAAVELSYHTRRTLRMLSGFHLRIFMSGDNEWILNKDHVRVAFRRTGVEVPDECISLPEEPITGPQEPGTEPQDLVIDVTVNGLFQVKVAATVYLLYKDPSLNTDMKYHQIWGNPPLAEVKLEGYEGYVKT